MPSQKNLTTAPSRPPTLQLVSLLIVFSNAYFRPDKLRITKMASHAAPEPDNVSSAEGNCNFDEDEYQRLRQYFLEPRVSTVAPTEGGRSLRPRRKPPLIEEPSYGYQKLRERIRLLESKKDKFEIFRLLSLLKKFLMNPAKNASILGENPILQSHATISRDDDDDFYALDEESVESDKARDDDDLTLDHAVCEVVDLTADDEVDVVDVDTYIIDVLLTKIVKADPDQPTLAELAAAQPPAKKVKLEPGLESEHEDSDSSDSSPSILQEESLLEDVPDEVSTGYGHRDHDHDLLHEVEEESAVTSTPAPVTPTAVTPAVKGTLVALRVSSTTGPFVRGFGYKLSVYLEETDRANVFRTIGRTRHANQHSFRWTYESVHSSKREIHLGDDDSELTPFLAVLSRPNFEIKFPAKPYTVVFQDGTKAKVCIRKWRKTDAYIKTHVTDWKLLEREVARKKSEKDPLWVTLAVGEYRKLLDLCSASKRKSFPSKAIEEVWKIHSMMHSYAKDVLYMTEGKRFIDFDTSLSRKVKARRYRNLRNIYCERMKDVSEINEEFWPERRSQSLKR